MDGIEHHHAGHGVDRVVAIAAGIFAAARP